MAQRTFVIGDIHGDLEHLKKLYSRLPELGPEDTLVFLGDYLDRGPQSKQVVAFVREELPIWTTAKIVALKGNHEDGWLRVVKEEGWAEFVTPPENGCLECVRSYLGVGIPEPGGRATKEEFAALLFGKFLPEADVAWMEALPHWYEDAFGIYVHACLPRKNGMWLHPSQAESQKPLLWGRDDDFFLTYEGKLVVCGHTPVNRLPQQLSYHTPGDFNDMFAYKSVMALDTRCGKGGFLTAVELPARKVYESR